MYQYGLKHKDIDHKIHPRLPLPRGGNKPGYVIIKYSIYREMVNGG